MAQHAKPQRRWKRIRKAVVAIGLFSSVLAQTASANVGDEMQGFFNGLGGAANVTGPAAFAGQSAGYYTGGSLYSRFPQKTINPANLQLPSVRAGCGGIDLFGGSFSFINLDEFIGMMKGIASNALGFAFQLAIKSISPQIASTMEELSQKIQMMNQFQMNSCQAAQQLVGGLWPKNDATSDYICKTVGNSQGKFADMARSHQGCGNEGKRNETLSGNSDTKVTEATPRNYTWEMLKQSYPDFDRDMKEFMMTLVGTVIYDRPSSGDGGPTYRFEGIADEAIMGALLDGTDSGVSVKVLRCDEPDKCMNVTHVNLSLPSSKALKPMVRAVINSMVDKIKTDSALTTTEISLLGATSLPLYKILTVSAASQYGGLTAGEIDNLSEYVAVDFLQVMMGKFTSEIVQGSASFQGADPESMKQWRDQLHYAAGQTETERGKITSRVQISQAVLERTVFLERSLRNSLSPQMSGALNFSRGAGAHGLR